MGAKWPFYFPFHKRGRGHWTLSSAGKLRWLSYSVTRELHPRLKHPRCNIQHLGGNSCNFVLGRRKIDRGASLRNTECIFVLGRRKIDRGASLRNTECIFVLARRKIDRGASLRNIECIFVLARRKIDRGASLKNRLFHRGILAGKFFLTGSVGQGVLVTVNWSSS